MTTDSRNPTERELEQDLETVRAALAAGEPLDPPELLDQAVMNRARRELEASGRKRGSLKWLGAFSTAAVVVLALTVVIQQEQPAPLPLNDEADGLKLEQDPVPAMQEARRTQPSSLKASRGTPVAPAGQVSSAKAVPEEEVQTRKARSEDAVPMEAAEAEAFALESMATDADALPTPEEWIEKMLRLKDDQQEQQLAEELAAFRAAYPDFPLPPGLGG